MISTTCDHDVHHITTEYDRKRQILVYYRTCEDCGIRLSDVARVDYRPDFNPVGNEPYLTAA